MDSYRRCIYDSVYLYRFMFELRSGSLEDTDTCLSPSICLSSWYLDSSVCCFKGAEDVGKTSLLRQLQVLGTNASISDVELHADNGGVADVDYAFFGARRLFQEEEQAAADVEARVNVWILQDPDAWLA